MKILDPKIKSAFDSSSRTIKVRATFNDTAVIDGQYIKSVELTDTMCSTDTLSLGNTCSSELQIEMFVPENFVGLGNAKIKFEVGIEVDGTVEYTNMGTFYTDNVTSKNNYKTVTITAYDSMLKLNELGNSYTCRSNSNKLTAIDIINDIAEQAGIDVNVKVTPDTITSTEDRTADNVSYETDGTAVQANLIYGVNKNNLIHIPPHTSTIEWRMYTEDGYTDPLRVCLFNDVLGTDFISYRDYSGLEISQYIDVETGEEYLTCTLAVPNVDYDMYLGFSLTGTNEEKAAASTYKLLITYTEDITLVNTGVMFTNPGTVDISPRAMLGYMAGVLGGNAKISTDNKLIIAPYSVTNLTIGLGQYFQNGFEKGAQTPVTIDYLTTGTEPDSNGGGGIITVGSGEYGFNFTNPYIDKTAAQKILDVYSGIKLLPASLTSRGNLAYESGDIVYVKDTDSKTYPVLICAQRLKVAGGMSATISGNLSTDSKESFISTPSTKTLTQVFSDFNEKYQTIVSMFTGVSGGYVKFVYDTQQKMRAIAIPDADIELKWDDTAGKVVTANGSTDVAMWVWNNGALGYTPDGGKTYATALTKDGQIYADGLLSYAGTIGGFNIDSTALWADNGSYRTYVQSAVYDEKSWAFSVQEKVDNAYYGRWWITSDGEQHCYNGIYLERDNSNIYNKDGDLILAPYQSGALVIGYGYYEKNYGTYIEGGTVYLVAQDGDKNRSIFTFDTSKWSDGVRKATMIVDRDLGIEVPDGKAVFVNCNGGAYIYGKSYVNGLDVAGESYLNGNTYINWKASDGLAPVYIDKNGMLQGSTSSARYKKDITTEFNEDLDPHKLYELPVKQYQYKDEHKDKQLVEGMQIGLIAEDVDEYYPNACQYNAEGEPESWRERIVLPAMLKLIQEQKAEIDELKARLDKIEKSKE